MIASHRPRMLLAALAAASLVMVGSVTGPPAANAAHGPAEPSQVTTMAALGDSITLGTMSCLSISGCAANSWSTGTNTKVDSHFQRLVRSGATELVAYNYAVSGAKSEELDEQAAQAVGQRAQYVTIEIGANDACTSTVGAMTSTEAFRANVRAALIALDASPADPQVFIAGIPDLERLHEINRNNRTAVRTWNSLKICQSMLANPTSNRPADAQRRAAVQQRVHEYNAVLQDECAQAEHCRYDGGAVANHRFASADISTRDYFHPSVTGQATLATVTWPQTQWAP